MKNNKLLLSGTIIAILSSSVLLAGKGGTPNGKPFVELAGQIVAVEGAISSLQEQVDELVGRVDSLEEDVSAHTSAITQLQARDVALKELIDENGGGDIVIMKRQIEELQGQNQELLELMAQGDLSLQVQIDTNDGLVLILQIAVSDVGILQEQIDALETANEELQNAIDAGDSTLQGDIEANLNLIAGLENDISGTNGFQETLNNNDELLSRLQNEVQELERSLELKQNEISGVCDSGEAIREVYADGSVRCQDAGITTLATAGLETYYVRSSREVQAQSSGRAVAECERGDKALSGSFVFIDFEVWTSFTNTVINTHEVSAYNRAAYSQILRSDVVCGRIVNP